MTGCVNINSTIIKKCKKLASMYGLHMSTATEALLLYALNHLENVDGAEEEIKNIARDIVKSKKEKRLERKENGNIVFGERSKKIDEEYYAKRKEKIIYR